MTDVFVNNAIQDAFQLYLDTKEQPDSIVYNDFLVSVIRMLILIYGENITEYYKNKDAKGFNDCLGQYGFSKENIKEFRVQFEKSYKSLNRQKDKAIKKKNKYFNMVQKYLIDMLVKKNEKENMDKNVIMEFYNLLFTVNNNDFYRKSVALLHAYDPYEIDDYFKSFNLV